MVKIPELRTYLQQEVQNYNSLRERLTVNASTPIITCKNSVTRISFTLEEFKKGDIVDCVDTLKKYYQDFPQFQIGLAGNYEFVGDRRSEMEQRWATFFFSLGKTRKDRNNRVKVSFDVKHFSRLNKERPSPFNTEISFEKEAEFTESDLQSVLDLWRKYAFLEVKEENLSLSPEEQHKSITEKLADLGAIVYQEHSAYTWESLAGYESLKKQVQETLVLPYLHRDLYRQIHALASGTSKDLIPRAALFEGPPGTGKTTMARILAREISYPLIYIPVESIMSCWYGVAEKDLARIFNAASQFERSLLFIDEIDSLAGSREKEMHEATRRILSVLLRKMQGLLSAENVLTIGATNRPDDLDQALLSRFSQRIRFPLPNDGERKAIFGHYARHLQEEDLQKLAEHTPGKSGRDLENLCAEAERRWARRTIERGSEPQAPPMLIYLEVLKGSSSK